MRYTGLHRALGLKSPVPITEEHLDQAIRDKIQESNDLDWKRKLPANEDKALLEFAKDVAAMANTAGGVLVYGMEEEEGTKTAKRRYDAGQDVDEGYEQVLRRCAATRIFPPIVNLEIKTISAVEPRAVIVLVGPSPNAPHLVFASWFASYGWELARPDAEHVPSDAHRVQAHHANRERGQGRLDYLLSFDEHQRVAAERVHPRNRLDASLRP